MNKSQIITGDALSVLQQISDNCIDCCVTSPPYFGLRDYGVEGQIGLEKSLQEYIDKMVEIFREVRRTLRLDGTLWLNLGDSYAGSGKGRNADGKYNNKTASKESVGQKNGQISKTPIPDDCKRKDLVGVPWELAFALRRDGWYLRQDIIWYKPNCMPESVKDRCTRSHEYIFLLSKSDKYYFDSEAIKEPAVTSDITSPRGSKGTKTPNSGRRKQDARYEGFNKRYFAESAPLMKNKRDVWSVSTHGYKEAHFATFPEKLIEPCVLAGCRQGGIVLDPFLGSGTTAAVAKKSGREYIGIELNPEYTEMARNRVAIITGDTNIA